VLANRSKPTAHPPRILYVASGPAPLSLDVLRILEGRFPGHQIDIVVPERFIDQLPATTRDLVVFVAGPRRGRLAFLWRSRREDYWLVVVLLSGHPGFVTMKLAALLLGVGRVIVCFNETRDAFAIDRHHLSAILAHSGNRLGTGRVFARGLQYAVLRALYMAFGEPAGLIWMSARVLAWRAGYRVRRTETHLVRRQEQQG
jgi:hypothetical protein